MNIETLNALEFFDIPQEKVPTESKAIAKFTKEALKTATPKDGIKIQQAIKTLHSFRSRFPQTNDEVTQTLFDIQKETLTTPDAQVRQEATVAFLIGFERHHVKTAQQAKQLIEAMGTLPNLEYLMPMVQRITHNLSNAYNLKLKSSDTDMSMAKMLRDFTAYCYWKHKKSTSYDWIHEITNNLANIYPIGEFQIIAKQFPPKEKISHPHKILNFVQPAQVYRQRYNRSANRISHIDDRD